MSLFFRTKKRFIFASLTLGLVLSSAFIPLNAGGVSRTYCSVRYAKEILYYSDATYTNHVGTGMIYCNGSSTLDGTSTAYRQETILDVCCGDPGGNGCVPC
jgi:hypothetical protein